jgi:uncharacterized protein
VRVVVVADTHIPDFARELPAALIPALRRADLILHAGDVTSRPVLEALAEYAPVRAVLGNRDRPEVGEWGAPEELVADLDGVRVAMVHDSGPRDGRDRRMRRRFRDADVVVFGHSHIPWNADHDGQRLFNPGSPTWKRRQPLPTYGELTIARGGLRARIVELPLPPPRAR